MCLATACSRAASFGLAPAQMEEYLLDSVKHDDAGNLDDELSDLTLANFKLGSGAVA